jgi:hypothetical protein
LIASGAELKSRRTSVTRLQTPAQNKNKSDLGKSDTKDIQKAKDIQKESPPNRDFARLVEELKPECDIQKDLMVH